MSFLLEQKEKELQEIKLRFGLSNDTIETDRLENYSNKNLSNGEPIEAIDETRNNHLEHSEVLLYIFAFILKGFFLIFLILNIGKGR